MEEKYVITLTQEQLSTAMTAIHMEIENGNYSDDIKMELLNTLLAIADFKVARA